MSRFIARAMASNKSALSRTQSHCVVRGICKPWRAKICSSRYNGKWSQYLLVMTYARTPGPGRPFSMGKAGKGAMTTEPSPPLGAYLRRIIWRT